MTPMTKERDLRVRPFVVGFAGKQQRQYDDTDPAGLGRLACLWCGWRIGKNLRVVRCARRPEPESSAKTAFVRCTIEAVPSVSQGGRAIGVERWRVLSNQIFSRFRRQAAIGV